VKRFAPFLAIIGGAIYRLRGGPLKDLWPRIFGTQLSRLFWAIPTGALMWFVSHGPLWLLPVLILSHFVAVAAIGTGQYLQDGPVPRTPDLLGTARTAIAALPLAWVNPLAAAVYALSGATHAHLYWLGFRLGKGSQLGEVFVGAACWFSILIFWR
jgi:hypothetical protein